MSGEQFFELFLLEAFLKLGEVSISPVVVLKNVESVLYSFKQNLSDFSRSRSTDVYQRDIHSTFHSFLTPIHKADISGY